MPTITPNLWFDTQAEEAANYYCEIFPNSRIITKTYYNDAVPSKAGEVLTVEWELDGQKFVGINGGPQFTFDEAVSFQIDCDDQDEIDYYWDRLTADGGKEGPCGWLGDKYGLAWQVVPRGIDQILTKDSEGGKRAMEAMFKMKKLDLATLKAAAESVPA
jgi:predicted 3-demethylubiquinone-9 3-methyltransferase (glyoxalase superfamily)